MITLLLDREEQEAIFRSKILDANTSDRMPPIKEEENMFEKVLHV